MQYKIAYHTDKGTKKKTNQDSFCLKMAKTSIGNVCMAVLCDGMGGLSRGELASGMSILRFAQWFEQDLVWILKEKRRKELIKQQLYNLVLELDEEMREYAEKNHIRMGTTLTAMIFLENDYILVQVGDSRAYEINEQMIQLTKDQSYVNQLIEEGKMTKEEAKIHPKRNVLLQCIGGIKEVQPVIQCGTVKSQSIYLLCSDGFIHKIQEDEIKSSIERWDTEEKKQEILWYLTELTKVRGEKDNITSMLIYCCEEGELRESKWKTLFQKKKKTKETIFQVETSVIVSEIEWNEETTESMEE